MTVDLVAIPAGSAAADDLSIAVMLTSPISSSVRQPRILPSVTEATAWGQDLSSLLVLKMPDSCLSSTFLSCHPSLIPRLTSGLLSMSHSLFVVCENGSICVTGCRRAYSWDIVGRRWWCWGWRASRGYTLRAHWRGEWGVFSCVILPLVFVFARTFWCKHCVVYAQLGIKLANGKQGRDLCFPVVL